MFDNRLTRTTLQRTLRSIYEPVTPTPLAIMDAVERLEALRAAATQRSLSGLCPADGQTAERIER